MSCMFLFFFFFKQKTAYELRISDWSSDVCFSDLGEKLQSLGKAAEHGQRAGDILVRIDAEGREIIVLVLHLLVLEEHAIFTFGHADGVKQEIGRASSRERVCQYV